MAVSQVTGARTVWVSDVAERDRKGSLIGNAPAILAHRYPGIPNVGDITAVDWGAVEPVDIITGGYPCQPFSHAGRRQGQADERHLWPHVADILAIMRPRIVVFENVRGHLTLGFDEVVRDLHRLGYDIRWTLLRASDIGACHQRARLFILGVQRERRVCSGPDRRGGLDRHSANHGGPGAARCQAVCDLQVGLVVGTGGKPVRSGGVRGPVPDERNDGGGARLRPDLTLLPTPTAQAAKHAGDDRGPGTLDDGNLWSVATRLLPTPRSSDTNGGGAHGDGGLDLRTTVALLLKLPPEAALARGPREALGLQPVCGCQAWGPYAAAVHRHELMLGRSAPSPTETGPRGNARLSARAVEWMMCLPDGWVTDVPGLTRSQQIRALGNGVVPPQATHALTQLLDGIPAASVAAIAARHGWPSTARIQAALDALGGPAPIHTRTD